MEASVDPELEFRDDAERGAFTATTPEGKEAGAAFYLLDGHRVVFTHTEVPAELEGHGVASALVQWALDDVRRRNLRAVPRCPYVRTWLRRHPEYADLVDPIN
jgi:predicted GNAT family acetyltransferase